MKHSPTSAVPILLTADKIVQLLGRSPYTVRHHASELIAKLGANNRAEAAAIVVKYGLVD